jgi:hypothetical protein
VLQATDVSADYAGKISVHDLVDPARATVKEVVVQYTLDAGLYLLSTVDSYAFLEPSEATAIQEFIVRSSQFTEEGRLELTPPSIGEQAAFFKTEIPDSILAGPTYNLIWRDHQVICEIRVPYSRSAGLSMADVLRLARIQEAHVTVALSTARVSALASSRG